MAGALAVMAVLPALAQTNLQLPKRYDEFREILKAPRQGPCERCGVVVSVRAGSPGERDTRPPRAASASTPGAGPANEIATAPIVGRAGREYRKELKTPPASSHIVTIRYDNGSYGVIEQYDEPQVRKGDRVRVTQGTLERVP